MVMVSGPSSVKQRLNIDQHVVLESLTSMGPKTTGFFAQRVHASTKSFRGAGLQKVRKHMNSPSFKDTRHGAADHRLDRCSLYIYGPLADMYADQRRCDICFMVMFARSGTASLPGEGAMLTYTGLLYRSYTCTLSDRHPPTQE